MDFRETSIEYLSCNDHATLYSSEAKWMRKIKQLKSDYPDSVQIINSTSESMVVHIPKSWLKVTPPRKMTLTDEQRAAAKERMLVARKNKKGSKNEET